MNRKSTAVIGGNFTFICCFCVICMAFSECHARSIRCWGFHPQSPPETSSPEHSITFSGTCTFTCCVPENDAKHHSPKTIRSYSFWDSVPCTPGGDAPAGVLLSAAKIYKLPSERKSCPNTLQFKSFWGCGTFFQKGPRIVPPKGPG